MKIEIINDFSGDFWFLSNFFPSKVVFEGMEYPTVEHAYQAAKTLNPMEQERIRQLRKPDGSPWPGAAKRMGKTVTLRPDWDNIKVNVMRELLQQKFTDPLLRSALCATGNARLIEGNWWGDTFWGVCRGKGTNMLGELLMTIRSNIGPVGGFHL